ncbi:16S rRNA (adenine(1518)-N(6)/adenine(1519)-N(6))-dimethyltransferase RsmA [Enterococcus timonensis]|uniref:16S rRNA (adenine(1518)-N(6)/adenine(1519)-N(6))- dimethyltransferase RsmA n=1 Tax=Enterococcus timonensis TaxID=1852364 RepID=UPI0008D90627|nr:16S rRNA (adenine(1518)-N(6)/adenine(1519)-N(6))-dimethyltransferase RsmA [Enterococcus timonensis]
MTDKLIATPSRTNEIMKKYNLKTKKSLGQNFITDPNILEKIVTTAQLDKFTNVVEVGPGIGGLTEILAQHSKKVLAYELDQRLLPVLADTLQQYDNITVLHQDVLQAHLAKDFAENFEAGPVKVVANLPYYITTPIMMHFLESDVEVAQLVVMMQKEVAERITAKPNSKAYGSLSIAVQYFMDAQIAFIVPKTVFVPQPNVDSAILSLEKRSEPLVSVVDEKQFFKLVKGAFQLRRKTLWNNLLSMYGKDEAVRTWLTEALQTAEIDPIRRGESLSIEDFARLSNALVNSKL